MPSREPSTAASEGDTLDDSRLAIEADDNASNSDLPARTATPGSTAGRKRQRPAARKPRPKKGTTVWVTEGVEGTEDESAPKKIKKSTSEEPDIKSVSNPVGTRVSKNGTVGSVYSGSKIRHIKKPDGVPLLRKDIQYAFLDEVVHNEKRCFTRFSDGEKDCTFAEIYIDCMAKSSKTSKILKDRLHVDMPAAQNMAMICLLVNVGRMNTTLNFFPEMRAQLRTYHPIPALQAYPTQKDYKSLQDAPRLKSILKGASEDEEQPRTLAQLRTTPIPRSNPVNLIFVLSQAANEISQLHFLDKIDFFDLAIRPTVTSHSRAVAFLWLMWWYLESDFTKEAALNNPFGPGEYKEDQDPGKSEDVPLLVPHLKHISELDGDAENIDTEEELVFGAKMTKERERFNAKAAEDEANQHDGREPEHKGIKKLKRNARELGDDLDSSDIDSRASPGYSARSPAPADTPAHLSTSFLQADSLEDDWEAIETRRGRGHYKRLKGKGTPSGNRARLGEAGPGSIRGAGGRTLLGLASDRCTPDTGRGTPQPPGINHPILSQFPNPRTSRAEPIFEHTQMGMVGIPSASKSRARTGYQRELEQHKQKRVDWLVNKKRKVVLKAQRAHREAAEPSWLLRDMYRISQLPDLYDSEDDDSATAGLELLGLTIPQHGTGLGGMIPHKRRGVKSAPTKERSHDGDDADMAGRAALAAHNDDLYDGVEDNYGEEAQHWKDIFRRTQRRLFTWSGDKDFAVLQRNRLGYQTRMAVPPPGLRVQGTGMDGAGDVADGTPKAVPARASGHESKKSLEDEITLDLLAERDPSEVEEGDEEDGDGDVTMHSY